MKPSQDGLLLVNEESCVCNSEESLDWKDWSVLGSLFVSGFSIIFMSSPRFLGAIMGDYVRAALCCAPLLFVCLFMRCRPLFIRSNRAPLLLICALLIVSYFNVSLSGDPERSKRAMLIFIFTGIIPFVSSLVIFRKWKYVTIFDIFCSACLALVVLIEVVAYLQRGFSSWAAIGVLVRNPIPTGTLVILLSSGPLWLIASRNGLQVLLGSVLASTGAGLILLTRKKGAFLAASLMFVVWAIVKRKKVALLVAPLLIVILSAIAVSNVNLATIMDTNNLDNRSHLDRLEFYPFAFHIFEKHPLMGIGARSLTQHQYLSDYSPSKNALKDFKEIVASIETFDNLYLTILVEFGGLFFILYFCLIAWICIRFYYAYQICPDHEKNRIYRILPLLAVAVHSITYDSLMFAPINWLFHVQLGILASIVTNREN
jgi:O-antigen ligase